MERTAIHQACREGDIDKVRDLIATDPAVVDLDDEHEWRPIFHAGLWRQEAVVLALIDHGADVNATNDSGHTVLYCAGGHGHLETLQLLLDQGAGRAARLAPDGQGAAGLAGSVS